MPSWFLSHATDVVATKGVSDEQTFPIKKKAAIDGDRKPAVALRKTATSGNNCVVSEASGITAKKR